jgi:hypothetical protein
MRTTFRLAAVVALLVGGGVAAQPPESSPAPARNVRELATRAGRYVVDYGEKVSLVVGVERYAQWMRGGGATEPQMRTLVSEFALVRADDDWVGFRDVLDVDGIAVEDHRDRLLTVLLNRSNEGLLLPSEMRESYEVAPAGRTASQETSTTINCVATYSDFRTFETFGKLIVR